MVTVSDAKRNKVSLSEKFIKGEITVEEYLDILQKKRLADRERQKIEKKINKLYMHFNKTL